MPQSQQSENANLVDLSPAQEIDKVASVDLQEAPVASQPSANESFQFSFPSLEEQAEVTDSAQDATDSNQQDVEVKPLQELSNLPSVDEEEDWLDEQNVTTSTPTLPSTPPEEQELDEDKTTPPLAVTESISHSHEQESTHTLEQEWLSVIHQTVKQVSAEALSVTTQAIKVETHHSSLSSEDMKVLIERIAWEVVPALASEHLRAELIKLRQAQ
jgi:hypothetical protein